MYKLESIHWWFVARRKIIAHVISKLKLPNSAKLLDAGCGNGDNLNMLSAFGKVTAIEKDPDACERAKNKNSAGIFQGHLPDNIPSNIGSNFDLVVLLDVLEHIDEDKSSLGAIKNLMKQDAILIITVPAFQWLWSRHDELHHHKRRYTTLEIKQLLQSNDYQVKYISYFNTLLFPLAILERIKQKVLPPTEETALTMPHPLLNNFLQKIFSLESHLIGRVCLPFGLSIIAIAEKRKNK